MNQEELKKMLNSVYEMEALIEMALRRDFSESHSIYGLIADKSFLIANMAAEWNPEPKTEEALNSDADDEKVIETFVENCLPTVDENVQTDSTEEDFSSEEESVSEVEEDNALEEIMPVVSDSSYADKMTDSMNENVVANADEESDNEESDEEHIGELEELYEVDEELPEIVFAEEFEIESDDFEVNDFETNDSEEEVETDYLKNHEERKDIRLFFTVNDKFRFKRELFGNNNVEFTESLNLVQTMKSLEEAEDYFYNDLQWDPESEDVKEFMNIITRFFKQ